MRALPDIPEEPQVTTRILFSSGTGYAVPARAENLTGLPPAFIAVGNLDGLMDEDIDYARRLITADVPTDLHVFADGTHAFDSRMPDTAVARRAERTLENWLQSHLHPAG